MLQGDERPYEIIFFIMGIQKKRKGRSRESDVSSRRMALKIRNMSCGILETTLVKSMKR
jgi:hypothetical protein